MIHAEDGEIAHLKHTIRKMQEQHQVLVKELRAVVDAGLAWYGTPIDSLRDINSIVERLEAPPGPPPEGGGE